MYAINNTGDIAGRNLIPKNHFLASEDTLASAEWHSTGKVGLRAGANPDGTDGYRLPLGLQTGTNYRGFIWQEVKGAVSEGEYELWLRYSSLSSPGMRAILAPLSDTGYVYLPDGQMTTTSSDVYDYRVREIDTNAYYGNGYVMPQPVVVPDTNTGYYNIRLNLKAPVFPAVMSGVDGGYGDEIQENIVGIALVLYTTLKPGTQSAFSVVRLDHAVSPVEGFLDSRTTDPRLTIATTADGTVEGTATEFIPHANQLVLGQERTVTTADVLRISTAHDKTLPASQFRLGELQNTPPGMTVTYTQMTGTPTAVGNYSIALVQNNNVGQETARYPFDVTVAESFATTTTPTDPEEPTDPVDPPTDPEPTDPEEPVTTYPFDDWCKRVAPKVAAYLGKPGNAKFIATAEAQLPIVLTFVHGYTRGRGFTLGTPDWANFDLEAVIISACARLVANPEQVWSYTAGDYSERPAVLQGWTLPEIAVLHRYRKRSA